MDVELDTDDCMPARETLFGRSALDLASLRPKGSDPQSITLAIAQAQQASDETARWIVEANAKRREKLLTADDAELAAIEQAIATAHRDLQRLEMVIEELRLRLVDAEREAKIAELRALGERARAAVDTARTAITAKYSGLVAELRELVAVDDEAEALFRAYAKALQRDPELVMMADPALPPPTCPERFTGAILTSHLSDLLMVPSSAGCRGIWPTPLPRVW